MKLGLNDWQFGSRVPDARGSLITLRRTFWWFWAKQDRKEFKSTVIYKKMQPVGFLYGLMLALGIILSRKVAQAIGISSTLHLIVLYSAAGTVGYLFSRRSYTPMIEWLCARRLARVECGACTFSLDGLPTEPDGCTLCPECGAAWRVPGVEDRR